VYFCYKVVNFFPASPGLCEEEYEIPHFQGTGHFCSAFTTTLLLLVTLTIPGFLEKRWLIVVVTRSIKIRAAYREELVREVKDLLKRNGILLKSPGISRSLDSGELSMDVVAAISDGKEMDDLVRAFSSIRDVQSFEIA